MLEAAAEPILKIRDGADPFSGTDCVGDVFHPAIGCPVICIGA